MRAYKTSETDRCVRWPGGRFIRTENYEQNCVLTFIKETSINLQVMCGSDIYAVYRYSL